MIHHLMNCFVKLTGFLPWLVVFRPKITGDRRPRGPVIIVSNHNTIYDYAAMLFVFPFRTLRCQMAEVLFRKKALGIFLRAMGGIFVNRNGMDAGCVEISRRILQKGGAVLIFPEGRIPEKFEEKPLPFKDGAALLSLETGVPILPVYTDGRYFCHARNHVVIGEPMDLRMLSDDTQPQRENLSRLSSLVRARIILLKEQEGKR